MKEEHFFYVPDAAVVRELPESEAQHAMRVLRLGEGDHIFLMDGEGCFYRATVALASKRHCFYSIDKVMSQSKGWNGHVHLAIAPTKMMERMEWMVEKAVEIGVDEITFLNCQFSERQTMRVDRMEKIVVAAMKQSRKPFKPIVHGMTDFAHFIETVNGNVNSVADSFIAHCYDDRPCTYLFDELRSIEANADVTVLVGPEGDFSASEVDFAIAHGFKPVTLGTSRLRTETAGLMAVAMMQLAKT